MIDVMVGGHRVRRCGEIVLRLANAFSHRPTPTGCWGMRTVGVGQAGNHLRPTRHLLSRLSHPIPRPYKTFANHQNHTGQGVLLFSGAGGRASGETTH